MKAPPHAHHYRLEEPNGPLSLGTCPCGARRDFKNFQEEGEFLSKKLTPCGYCGQILKTKGGMAMHVRNAHKGEVVA